MRTKIGITIMAIFMVAMTTNVFGQETPDNLRDDQSDEPKKMLSPGERAGKKTEKMITHLGLTAEQTEKVTPMMLEHEQKMQVLMDEQKSLRQKMRAEREALKSNIDQILTEEQKVKRDELIEQRKQERQNQPGQCCACCGKH